MLRGRDDVEAVEALAAAAGPSAVIRKSTAKTNLDGARGSEPADRHEIVCIRSRWRARSIRLVRLILETGEQTFERTLDLSKRAGTAKPDDDGLFDRRGRVAELRIAEDAGRAGKTVGDMLLMRRSTASGLALRFGARPEQLEQCVGVMADAPQEIFALRRRKLHPASALIRA